MVYAKVVENKEIGRCILPAFFPIGVLANRFGYINQNIKQPKTLEAFHSYLVYDKQLDKMLVKKLKKADKQAYYLSFITRNASEFESTNEFTREYEIVPSDIVLEEEAYGEAAVLTPSLSAQQVPDRKSHHLPELIEEIYDEETTQPVDLEQAGFDKKLTSEQEEAILKTCINYYLLKLGLTPIDRANNHYPLHHLSTKGDALLNYALLDYFMDRHALQLLLANESMKYALARLGFHEFLRVNTHLAGTFFEVIYACAVLQDHDAIQKSMEKELVGEAAFENRLPLLIFKKTE